MAQRELAMCLRFIMSAKLIMKLSYHGDRAKSSRVRLLRVLQASSPDLMRSLAKLRDRLVV
jgi:hypothetical protein